MFEPVMLLLVVATFLSTGTVKAVIGLGLPTVSLGLLTAALDLPTAMALLLVPSFVRNVCQASTGGHALTILGRTGRSSRWPLLRYGSARPRRRASISISFSASSEKAGFGPVLLARPACRADPLTVPEALAAHAVSVIDIRQPDIVAVSGGEMALALIKALRVGSLRVLGQPMLGICAATMAYGGTSLLFLTKAGGFGREAVFVYLASKFRLRAAI